LEFFCDTWQRYYLLDNGFQRDKLENQCQARDHQHHFDREIYAFLSNLDKN